ncbi:hypothetical protein PJM49_26445 [Mycobacterium kansasii]
MTATESASAAPPTHPRDRSMESWRARLGVLASRGETDGPRVAEARAALSWHRTRATILREMNITEERADSLMDLLDQHADTEAVAR